jgi:exodeoxyribonuclease-5
MVGAELGNDLMLFGKPVIAIGDPGQLPPVQDKPFFPLHEPDFLLTEIHRQALDNPIIRLSQNIREGKNLRLGRMGDTVRVVLRGDLEIPEDDIPQIIVGRHVTRWDVTDKIRRLVKGYDSPLPVEGEPLLCRKNSMAHPLINGQECRAVSFEPATEDHVLDVAIEGLECRAWDGPFREHAAGKRVEPELYSADWAARKQNECFDFGWAITCHAAQGSQWDDVLVYDESFCFREERSRWLYTAVTRAAQTLTIIK